MCVFVKLSLFDIYFVKFLFSRLLISFKMLTHVYRSVCLSVCLPACLSVSLFFCLSVFLSICFSVCLSFSHSFSVSSLQNPGVRDDDDAHWSVVSLFAASIQFFTFCSFTYEAKDKLWLDSGAEFQTSIYFISAIN